MAERHTVYAVNPPPPPSPSSSPSTPSPAGRSRCAGRNAVESAHRPTVQVPVDADAGFASPASTPRRTRPAGPATPATPATPANEGVELLPHRLEAFTPVGGRVPAAAAAAAAAADAADSVAGAEAATPPNVNEAQMELQRIHGEIDHAKEYPGDEVTVKLGEGLCPRIRRRARERSRCCSLCGCHLLDNLYCADWCENACTRGRNERLDEAAAGRAPSSIELTMGSGSAQYFYVLRFFTLVNLLMSIPVAILYIAVHNRFGLNPNGAFEGLARFSVAAFPPEAMTWWIVCSATMLTIWFVAVIWFLVWDSREWVKERMVRRIVDAPAERKDNRVGDAELCCQPSRHCFGSWKTIVWVILPLSALGASVWFIRANLDVDSEAVGVNEFGIRVGAVIPFLDSVFRAIAYQFPFFEYHRFSTDLMESNVRVGMLVRSGSLYILNAYNVLPRDEATCGTTDCACSMGEWAVPLVWLMVFNIFASPLMGVLISWVGGKCCRRLQIACTTGERAEAATYLLRVEHEPSTEYTEIGYRQLIILYGSFVYPPLVFLGAVSFMAKELTDHLIFRNFMRKRFAEYPIHRKYLATYFLGICSFIIFFALPHGLALMLTVGNVQRECSFFQ